MVSNGCYFRDKKTQDILNHTLAFGGLQRSHSFTSSSHNLNWHNSTELPRSKRITVEDLKKPISTKKIQSIQPCHESAVNLRYTKLRHPTKYPPSLLTKALISYDETTQKKLLLDKDPQFLKFKIALQGLTPKIMVGPLKIVQNHLSICLNLISTLGQSKSNPAYQGFKMLLRSIAQQPQSMAIMSHSASQSVQSKNLCFSGILDATKVIDCAKKLHQLELGKNRARDKIINSKTFLNALFCGIPDTGSQQKASALREAQYQDESDSIKQQIVALHINLTKKVQHIIENQLQLISQVIESTTLAEKTAHVFQTIPAPLLNLFKKNKSQPHCTLVLNQENLRLVLDLIEHRIDVIIKEFPEKKESDAVMNIQSIIPQIKSASHQVQAHMLESIIAAQFPMNIEHTFFIINSLLTVTDHLNKSAPLLINMIVQQFRRQQLDVASVHKQTLTVMARPDVLLEEDLLFAMTELAVVICPGCRGDQDGTIDHFARGLKSLTCVYPRLAYGLECQVKLVSQSTVEPAGLHSNPFRLVRPCNANQNSSKVTRLSFFC